MAQGLVLLDPVGRTGCDVRRLAERPRRPEPRAQRGRHEGSELGVQVRPRRSRRMSPTKRRVTWKVSRGRHRAPGKGSWRFEQVPGRPPVGWASAANRRILAGTT